MRLLEDVNLPPEVNHLLRINLPHDVLPLEIDVEQIANQAFFNIQKNRARGLGDL